MTPIEKIIHQQVGKVLKEDTQEEEKKSPLERLDSVLKELSNASEDQAGVLEALFAPYIILRDLFKLAVTGLKLIANDIVFMVKKSLAVRPSSWAKAVEGHEKRLAKLNKDWNESLKATGADSKGASVLAFLALPGPMIAGSMISQGVKTAASINHGLIDVGIRLPLIQSIVPGSTPPEELEMTQDQIKDKKRGELTTKDAVKAALLSLFFAHHQKEGEVILEKEDSKIPEVKITPDAVTQHLDDMGVLEKINQDLRDIFEKKEKAIRGFIEKENIAQKFLEIGMILKIQSPEELDEVSRKIQDGDLKKIMSNYKKSLDDQAAKMSKDKEFVAKVKEKMSDGKSTEAKEVTEDTIKSEALGAIFGGVQKKINQQVSESFAEYSSWVFTSCESIYKVSKEMMKNPIVEEGVNRKNRLLEQLINNIQM